MAEQYYAYSAFSYTLNNALSNTDPNGKWVRINGGLETSDPGDIAAFFEDMRGRKKAEEYANNLPFTLMPDISQYETRGNGGDCGGPDQPPCIDGLNFSQKVDQQFLAANLLETYGIVSSIRAIQRGVFNLASSLKSWFAAKDAAKGVTNTVTKSESVLGHIFRDAAGHVNPSTVASQNRYIRLFESVANNPANLNQSILAPRAIENGVQGFTQSFKNGQIWVQVKDGKIFNAGVNLMKK